MLLERSGLAEVVDETREAAGSVETALGADTALVSRIERIVRCRTGCRIRDLRVDLSGDRVVISGVASTYYAKQLATHAALDEIRGRSLTNAIEVH